MDLRSVSIRSEIYNQIWDQVAEQVRQNVFVHLQDQTGQQIYDQAKYQVYADLVELTDR